MGVLSVDILAGVLSLSTKGTAMTTCALILLLLASTVVVARENNVTVNHITDNRTLQYRGHIFHPVEDHAVDEQEQERQDAEPTNTAVTTVIVGEVPAHNCHTIRNFFVGGVATLLLLLLSGTGRGGGGAPEGGGEGQ